MDWRQKLLNAAKAARHKYSQPTSPEYLDAVDRTIVKADFDSSFEAALIDIGQRDREITALYYQGYSSIELGLRYGLSATRILQIVHTATRLLLKGANIHLFLQKEDNIKDESA